jgi:peptide/nickel transport system substrate-binding protein
MVAVLGVLAGVTLTAAVGPSAAGQDEPVTLTIGLQQDLDSANVTQGYLVSSFEFYTLQYATLTDKAADDFATIPGLAESWEPSPDGLTYTYTLREGLTWSDGEPLTADDVAYTINRSRDEEWLNHSATTVNLDATAIDERTVEVTSSVPDPKLPTLDVYIVPQHVFESISADDLATYDGLDGVGSGPFVLDSRDPGQGWTMTANPSYWGWEGADPPIDRVVFRIFTNGDAMVAALQQGEIDAAHDIPSGSYAGLDEDPDIVAVTGQQGSFSELAMNGSQGGLGDGHPALLDIDVRHAIAHAIDRQVLLERVIDGLGAVGSTISVSPDPVWKPDIPAEEQFGFDPERANQLLDDAGYLDTDGDGVREMPDGSQPLEFRYALRSESELEPALNEFISGWLQDIGIATTIETYDDTQLTDIIGAGTYDLFTWGWTPFVDPDPMLSYFTCVQVTTDIEAIGYNDANWCSEEYDALYEQQKVELDRDARVATVREMLRLFHDEATYVVLLELADLQAYRTDRFEGWTQQPAGTGPVIFTNTSPTYVNLRPIGAEAEEPTDDSPASDGADEETAGGDVTIEGEADDDDGGSNTGVVVAVAAGAGAAVLGGLLLVRSRRNREYRD